MSGDRAALARLSDERDDGAPRHHRAIAIAAVLACGIALVAPVAWRGIDGLGRGDAEARRGELDRAIESWTAAARAYLPAASYVPAAHQRLLEAGDAAAARGELARAERAYAAVSAAIEDTQWIGAPFAASLARAEAGRQALRGQQAPAKLRRNKAAAAAPTAASAAAPEPPLARAPAPPVAARMADAARARGWAAVAFAGLLGAALAVALLRRDRGGARSALLARRTKLAMAMLAVCAGIFALGVHQV